MANTPLVVSVIIGSLILTAAVLVVFKSAENEEGSYNFSGAVGTEVQLDSTTQLDVPDDSIAPGMQELGAGWSLLKGTMTSRPILKDDSLASVHDNTLNKKIKIASWVKFLPTGQGFGSATTKYMEDAASSVDSDTVALSGGMDGLKAGENPLTPEVSASLDTAYKSANSGAGEFFSAQTTKQRNFYDLKLEVSNSLASSFTDEFATSLADAKQTPAKWNAVFDQFGTHIISQVSVGGKLSLDTVFRSTLGKSSIDTALNTGVQGSLPSSMTGAPGSIQAGLKTTMSSEESASATEKNMQASYKCTGGDTTMCDSAGAGIASWLSSIESDPKVIERQVSSICEIIAYAYRVPCTDAFNAYFNTQASQCPGFNSKPMPMVGDIFPADGPSNKMSSVCSGHGTCNPTEGKCYCQPGYTGTNLYENDCNGKIPDPPMLGYPSGTVVLCKDKICNSANRLAVNACSWVNKCWNVDGGPRSGFLKNDNNCAMKYAHLPTGWDFETFDLQNRNSCDDLVRGFGCGIRWSSFNNQGTCSDHDIQNCVQNGQCQDHTGNSGSPEAQPLFTSNVNSCGGKFSLQPGYTCNFSK